MWPFAFMQLAAGVLTDRIGARRCVALLLAIAGAGQILFAVAPNAGLALLGRGLSGLGFGTLFVGAALIMTQWFRPREFSTLTAVCTSVGNLGSFVASAAPGDAGSGDRLAFELRLRRRPDLGTGRSRFHSPA